MRRSTVAATGLCLAAGVAVIWVEASGPPSKAVSSNVALPARSVSAPRPVDATMLADQILERPLFTPTRRPYVAASPSPAPAAPVQPPELPGKLLGTAIGPALRLALFRRNGSGETVLVSIGDTIDRWTVTQIALGSVTLHPDIGETQIVPIQKSVGVAPPIKLQLGVFHHNLS
jgi:hypothetical protein